jgi:soluble lytic murein transglycosylase
MKRLTTRLFAASGVAFFAFFGTPEGVRIPGFTVSEAQADSLAAAAAKSALSGDFSNAGALARRSGDRAAIKLVELIYLKDHWKDAGYKRIVDFIDNSPNWPLAETLNKRAEYSLYEEHAPADLTLAHFGKQDPITAQGYLALARAQITMGDTGAAQKAVLAAWTNADVESDLESSTLKEFGSMISADMMRQRVWCLVLNQKPNAAIRNAKRVGGGIVDAANVAQLLLREVSGADKKYTALSASQRSHPAMLYSLARFYRKQEKYGKAREALAAIPGDTSAMVDAGAIWTERRIIARRSVGPEQQSAWKDAYRIASRHGLTEGADAADANLLAGWIALRRLNDAQTSISFFKKALTQADSRTDKSRANYWSGRAYQAIGDEKSAAVQFNEAAQYATLYYGQLAREEVGLATVPEKIATGMASDSARKKVEQDEVVRAFRIMNSAGADSQLNMFLWPLAKRFSTVDEMNAVADIVSAAGGTAMTVRFAKAAGHRGIDIDSWSYPVRGLPDWQRIGKPVEKSLVFALSRQESEFDPHAGSAVGAQGLMQLMPGTARLVAKQYGMAFAASRLKSDPAYNVKLGAAHLADLVSDNGGSYVLTLVAYNAGPRRVTEWVQQYGDPRSGKIDAIDWVESIPFQETRQYVQKVMQNLHIYRSRFAPDSVRAMSADLRRGGSAKMAVADGSFTSSTSCAGASISSLIASCE